MHLRQLAYLRMIVETGSFEQAGGAAGVSQSAVTQAMRALQAELGLTLFRRDGTRNLPTPEAVTLARAGEQLQQLVLGLQRRAADGQAAGAAPAQDLLRVAVAPAAGLLYGPAMHACLHQQFPTCLLQLQTDNAPNMLWRLLAGELDLVVGPAPRNLRNPRLRQHVMYTSEPGVFCRSGHPLAQARTLADIVDAQWVVAGVPGSPGNVIEEAFRVRRLRPPQVAVHCADYPMLLRLVGHSDLLGVVSHPALVRPRGMGVQRLALVEGLPHYQVCLFWTADAPGGGARDAVRDLLQALGRP